jgi:hypothetical protein
MGMERSLSHDSFAAPPKYWSASSGLPPAPMSNVHFPADIGLSSSRTVMPRSGREPTAAEGPPAPARPAAPVVSYHQLRSGSFSPSGFASSGVVDEVGGVLAPPPSSTLMPSPSLTASRSRKLQADSAARLLFAADMYHGHSSVPDTSLQQFMQEDALRQKAQQQLLQKQQQQQQQWPARSGQQLFQGPAGMPNALRSRSLGRFDALPVTVPGNAPILPPYGTDGSLVTPAPRASAKSALDLSPPRLERPMPFLSASELAATPSVRSLEPSHAAGAVHGLTVYDRERVTARPSSALKQRALSRQAKRVRVRAHLCLFTVSRARLTLLARGSSDHCGRSSVLMLSVALRLDASVWCLRRACSLSSLSPLTPRVPLCAVTTSCVLPSPLDSLLFSLASVPVVSLPYMHGLFGLPRCALTAAAKRALRKAGLEEQDDGQRSRADGSRSTAGAARARRRLPLDAA